MLSGTAHAGLLLTCARDIRDRTMHRLLRGNQQGIGTKEPYDYRQAADKAITRNDMSAQTFDASCESVDHVLRVVFRSIKRICNK